YDSGRDNLWHHEDVRDAGIGAARIDQQAVGPERSITIGVIRSRWLDEHATRRADQSLSREHFLEGARQEQSPARESVLVAGHQLIGRVTRFRQSVTANRHRLSRTAVRD